MMDKKKIEEGVRLILEGVGEDVNREGLIDTPKRVSAMYEELLNGMELEPEIYLNKRFTATNNEMVVEKDINFYSLCEHHMVPFYGKVHIAYIPDGEVVGLSKLARCVEVYARRLQIQENMTVQIADAIEACIKPKGVMVIIEAEHMCMTMRGVKKPGTKTVTYVTRGEFKNNDKLVDRFFSIVKE